MREPSERSGAPRPDLIIPSTAQRSNKADMTPIVLALGFTVLVVVAVVQYSALASERTITKR